MTSFTESEERQELRKQVAKLASKYGRAYFTEKARTGGKTTDLWLEMGKNGYLGINIPEEYGGGGGGIGDIAAVCEELAAQGCPLLMMVVSPAICGTVISRYGTDEQKRRWLPGIADGTGTMAFAITEPDAGTNSHNITTTARRDGDEWLLNGRKIYISGVDEADNVLVVARAEDAKTGKLKPCLFVVPTDAAGFEYRPIPMEIISPEQQFQVFIDDLRLPSDALVGDEDAGLVQLFAGLNPERIMAASFSTGLARFAIEKAAAYAKERVVFQAPIGSHQAIAHPLAMSKIETELARLMTQKAAALYDAGDDMGAGEAANMAKYAAAEAACDAADRAVQTHGGNGITQEYGMAGLLVATRAGRIAPVSREMILNFVAMHSLGLPSGTKSVLETGASRQPHPRLGEVRGRQVRAAPSGFGEHPLPGGRRDDGVVLGGVCHLRRDQLDRVHEHVAGQQQRVVARAQPHRLVTGRVARRRLEVEALTQPGGTVDLAQQAGRRERVDRRCADDGVVGDGRDLGGLDDVRGVGEERGPVRSDHPSDVVLVQVGQHHGADVGRVDAQGRQLLGQAARPRRPRGCRAGRRTDAEVDHGDRAVGRDHHERAERQHPGVVRPEGSRVERSCGGPLLLGRPGERLPVRGVQGAGDVDDRMDLIAADRPHRSGTNR